MNTVLLLLIIIIKNINGEDELIQKIIANVTLLLAQHHKSDCVQIFRGEKLSNEVINKVFKIWKELAVPESNTTTGVYSFDRYVKRKANNPWKMTCYQPFRIIMGDEESKLGFNYVSHTMSVKGSIWLFFLKVDIVEFFRNAYLPFDIQLFVATIKAGNFVELHEVYRVNQTFPIRVVKYGKWTKDGGLDVVQELFYNRRSDLEGVVVKLGSIENWPTSYKTFLGWDGYFPILWNLIQSKINCSSIHYDSIDGTTGSQENDGTWNGLVGMAIRKEIDIIVSELSMDKSRSRVLDYFHPTLKTRYQIYFHWLGNDLKWASIFQPFGKTIWIAIVVWLLVGTLGISICYYFSLMCGFEDDTEKIFSPTRSFYFMLQSLCQQGHYAVPRSTACRILFFTSYLVSSVLIPSYSASLISYLTQQNPYRPFDSLDEMVADGSYRLLVKDNTAEYSYFSESDNELLQTVYKKLIVPTPEKYHMKTTKQALHTVCTVPRYALFGIKSVFDTRIKTDPPECPIISLSKPLSVIYLTMGVAKGHPYYGLINHHLHKLIDVGIARRTEKKVWPITKLEAPTVKTEVETEEVFQMFVLTGVFIVLSATILWFEKLYYKWEKRNGKAKPVEVPVKKYPFKHYNWHYRIDIYV